MSTIALTTPPLPVPSAEGLDGHDRVVEAIDTGLRPTGVPVIVLEELGGTTLAEEIDRVGGLPVRRAPASARSPAT